jgi:hypothetical protein
MGSREARREFKSKEDFSLPFTIRPGARTLHSANPGGRHQGTRQDSGGAYFLLSNTADRASPIAKRKRPALSEVGP